MVASNPRVALYILKPNMPFLCFHLNCNKWRKCQGASGGKKKVKESKNEEPLREYSQCQTDTHFQAPSVKIYSELFLSLYLFPPPGFTIPLLQWLEQQNVILRLSKPEWESTAIGVVWMLKTFVCNDRLTAFFHCYCGTSCNKAKKNKNSETCPEGLGVSASWDNFLPQISCETAASTQPPCKQLLNGDKEFQKWVMKPFSILFKSDHHLICQSNLLRCSNFIRQ